MSDMRLFKRRGYPNWYIEIRRGKVRSLRTTDTVLAKQIFRKMQRRELEGKLYDFKRSKRITLADWKDRYLSERGHLSDNTTRGDDVSLRMFGDVIGHDTAVKTINREHIKDFISAMKARGAKVSTINAHLIRIKAALREAKRCDFMDDAPDF